MKKLLLISLSTMLIPIGLSAQNDDIFHNIKFGLYGGFSTTPIGVVSTSEYDNVVNKHLDNYSYLTLVSISYTFRYNLLESGNNFGLGLNSTPYIGALILGDDVAADINLPLYTTLNWGAGSTYSTPNSFGFYIGGGYEITKAIIDNPEYKESLWTQPMIITGFRWWTKKEKLFELSIKYGFSSNEAKTIQLTWGKFLNY